MKLGIVLAVALVACVLADGKAQAQGVQTGSLAGTVRDATGLVLPGVTVTATSAAMQGLRTTVSGGNGDYLLPGLPAGTYTVTFALDGFAEREETATAPLGAVAEVNTTMELAGGGASPSKWPLSHPRH